MSQQGFPGLGNQSPQQQGVAVEKPKSDVYTVMLLIALLAIGIAIALPRLRIRDKKTGAVWALWIGGSQTDR